MTERRLPAILIPAAGQSKRMGGVDKLLCEVGGTPLLRHVAAQALGTGAQVHIALPADNTAQQIARRSVLDGLDVALIKVKSCGLGDTLAQASRSMARGPLMILLADMPMIETFDIKQVMQVHWKNPDRPCRAMTPEGRHGHPVILPAHLRGALEALRSDMGAGAFLQRHEIATTTLQGKRAVLDLDRPEDWKTYLSQ